MFGAKIDVEDVRDVRYLADAPGELPPSVDLRPFLPPAWDQSYLGSCEGMAGAGLMAFLYPGFDPSALAIYYRARQVDGTEMRDSGAYTRSMMKALRKGVVWDNAWPYQTDNVFLPPPETGNEADHRIALYARMTQERELLNCLASGFPFVMSFCCSSVMNDPALAGHGVHWKPEQREAFMPAHAVLCVGYDRDFGNSVDLRRSGVDRLAVDETALLVRNSWGPRWGIDGHFWLPISWALDVETGGDMWFGHRLVTNVSERDGARVGGIKIEGQFV